MRLILESFRQVIGRRSIYVSAEVAESAARIFKPSYEVLTPAEVAFAHRLGMSDVRETKFRSALAHPLLPRSKPMAAAFEKYKNIGARIIDIFAKDYVTARFARLPRDSKELAVKVYTTNKNLAAVAKSVGIEYAIIEFTGIPCKMMSSLEEYLNKMRDERDSKVADIRPTAIYSEIFQSLIGICFTQKGALETRKLLDALLFSGTFNKNLLCRPKNPMLKLARAMENFKRNEPDYRLLHETGRLSDTSIYVVGVYSGLDKLAEAHGPSMLVAQERAAIEALGKLFIVDTPDAGRKSDVLLEQKVPIISVERLKDLIQQ